jgi:hypothetical protein
MEVSDAFPILYLNEDLPKETRHADAVLHCLVRFGLCCTNELEVELPLSPSGVSLWPLSGVCQEL